MTNAEAWFNKSLRPRKPEGSLGRTAQDVHLDSHTAPELSASVYNLLVFVCTGTPMANLIALLSILCSFFRSVFGAEKYTS